MKQSNEQLRKRWISEYIWALDERHRYQTVPEETKLPIVMVALIKGSLESKGEWRTAWSEGEILGKDGVVRKYKVRQGNGYIVERPI